MYQAGNSLGLHAEFFHATTNQAHLEQFDGSLCLQVNMLTKVDIGEASLS